MNSCLCLSIALTESRHCAGPLSERSLPGRRQAPGGGQRLALGRAQGMEQRRAHLPAETHV